MSDEQMKGKVNLLADMAEACMESSTLATDMTVEMGNQSITFRVQIIAIGETEPSPLH